MRRHIHFFLVFITLACVGFVFNSYWSAIFPRNRLSITQVFPDLTHSLQHSPKPTSESQVGSPILSSSFLPEGYNFNKDQALTLYQLELCKAAKYGPKNGALDCPDPVCLGCITREYIERAEGVQNSLKDAELREARESLIHRWFPEHGSTVVVVGANKHFERFVFNFECALRSRVLNSTDKLLLVAADEVIYKHAKARGIKVMNPVDLGIPQIEEENHPFEDSLILLIAAAHELISMGYNVVMQDADVVWIKSPLWIFDQPTLKAIDMHFQLAATWDARGVANTAFIMARSTNRTLLFLKTLLKVSCIIYWQHDDQIVWNTMLRHYAFDQLNWQTLPRRYGSKSMNEGGGQFLDLHTKDGKDGTASWIDEGTVVLHATEDRKEEKLRLTGNWFLREDERCDSSVR